MSQHDEITEEVPAPETPKKPEEAGPDPKNSGGRWRRSELSYEDMNPAMRREFHKKPLAEQKAYLQARDDENAAATAYMAAELAEHRRTHVYVPSKETLFLRQHHRETAADEAWEQRLRAERTAMEEQKEFLTRAVRELSAIINEVAREEDLDSIPGWAIAAFELLPYVSAAYALFGVEIATKRDPNTDEVTGLRIKELTAAERAIHVTIGEMAVSKKLSMSAMKIVKKVMARALRSSTRYVTGAAKKAITQAV